MLQRNALSTFGALFAMLLLIGCAASVSHTAEPQMNAEPPAEAYGVATSSGGADYAEAEYAPDEAVAYEEAAPASEVAAPTGGAPSSPPPVAARDSAPSDDRASSAPPPSPAARPAPTKAPASARRPASASGGGAAPSVAAERSAAPPPPPSAPSLDAAFSAPAGAVMPTPPPPPAVSGVIRQVPVVSQLTAASVGDVDRRGPYLDYLSRHPAEQAQIQLDMSRRVRFRVLDGQSRPLNGAVISFTAGNHQVEGRTHADGYWDFFPNVSAPQAAGSIRATVRWRSQQANVTFNVPPQGDGQSVAIQLPQAAAIAPATLDLAFLIDVTGSMGDELAYVNHEVMGIVQRVRQAVNQVNVRVAATFYRDRGDMQPLQQIPFTTNVAAFNTQMAGVRAGGGGDYPEDLNAGLGAALTTLRWTDGPAVRVLVIISDAPPQQYPNTQYTYHHAMRDASRRGIRILPVAASGADRVVEYLFRAMGAFTSTPYVYLTDDSGIGGHHMEADTDRISVEMFSDLLTRMLIADLQGQGMHEPSHDQQGQILAQ